MGLSDLNVCVLTYRLYFPWNHQWCKNCAFSQKCGGAQICSNRRREFELGT